MVQANHTSEEPSYDMEDAVLAGVEPANDNVPKWDADEATRARSAEMVAEHKAAVAAYYKPEAKAVAYQTRRINKRQNIGEGWDGAADNDNPIGWPLAKALLADGKQHLLKYAMRYRRIEASATSDARLDGKKPESEMVSLDHETHIMPNGEIAYGKVRKSQSADAIGSTPSRRSSVTNEATMHPSSPVAKKWNGDAKVIDMVDDKRRLGRLRCALGPIVEPFEEAVLHGATLEAVGRSMGVGNRTGATGAAKAVVMIGLMKVADELGEIRRHDLAA